MKWVLFQVNGRVVHRMWEERTFSSDLVTNYMLFSGMQHLVGRRATSHVFSSSDIDVVENAFGGAQYMPSRQDPFRKFQFVRQQESVDIMKTVCGFEGKAVVVDPRKATKLELLQSIEIEMGELPENVESLCKGELVDLLLTFRVQTQSYFGMKYIYSLEVSQAARFVITMNSACLGQTLFTIRFKICKEKVVFTLNQDTVLMSCTTGPLIR